MLFDLLQEGLVVIYMEAKCNENRSIETETAAAFYVGKKMFSGSSGQPTRGPIMSTSTIQLSLNKRMATYLSSQVAVTRASLGSQSP